MAALFDMSIEELINTEVSIATKSSQRIFESPANVSVISAEVIYKMGFRELEEVLQSIPGFEFTQTRYSSKPFGVRGVSDIRQGGRLLILIDGIPYNGVMYGSSVYYGRTFNIDAIEKIEVIRGPGSALYGRNAFSGVVNIITKKATKDKQLSVGTSYGSYNTSDGNIELGVLKNDFNCFINAKYYSTDGTDSEFNNGQGGESVWNLTHDNLYINSNIKYKGLQFNGSFTNRINGSSAGMFLTHGNNDIKVGTYALSYFKELNSKLNFKLKVYSRNENRVQNIELYKPNTIDIHPVYGVPIMALAPEGVYAQPIFDAYTYGAELETKIKILNNNDLLFGIQADVHGIKNATVKATYDLATDFPLTYFDADSVLRYYTKENMPLYEPGWIIDGGHNYKNFAIYLQDVIQIRSNIGITIGGRFDIDSESGFILNPRLGIVWEPYKSLFAKLLYGEAYRAPTANEQYKIVGLEKGNKDLEYEEIKTTELSVSKQINKYFGQIAVFYNKLDNLILQQNIVYNGDSVGNDKSYFNNGKNTSYGFEVENKLFISNSFYTFLNYSFSKSEDVINYLGRDTTIDHQNISPNKYNFGFNTNINKYLDFTVHLRYHGQISKFINTIPYYSGQYVSKDPVGKYYMLNSSIRIKDIFKGFNIAVYGYNLLNQVYYYQDDINEHQPKQPGIHFLIKLNYHF
ncbi:TonB-dependent receptor plug domain-containing protein [Bacteroidota bacterium]